MWTSGFIWSVARIKIQQDLVAKIEIAANSEFTSNSMAYGLC
jgi:hypothetical protein